MYERHFHFTERPFPAAPRAASYVATANLEHARTSLIRCALRAEGIGLAIGSAGTGKSLLCQLLAEHFRPGPLQVSLLDSARLHTRRSLLQNILFGLHLPYRGMDDEELRLSLLDHLTPRGGGPGGLVLLIDEAHTLPLRLLEEMRLISNFVKDGEPRVRLVLVGAPAMEERLANPKLESLSQRIAVRAYLSPLNREETGVFVRQQIARAGGDAAAMCPEPVLRAIHQATDGIPRLINQVCDHALILAAIDGDLQLTPRRIEEAWADLQQLPSPWQETAKSELAGQSEAIEFGQLDESPEDNEPAAVGTQALSDLSKIGEAITALERDDEPSTDRADEVSDDPFGGGFDEEEIVIDRYATLESQSVPSRSRVSSIEGQILGQALRSATSARTEPIASKQVPIAIAPLIEPESAAIRVSEPTIADDCASDMTLDEECSPASDPVLPEISDDLPAESYTSRPLSYVADDDRDLIVVQNAVVQDAAARQRQIAATPDSRRRQYRRLFSSLRRP